MESKYVAVDLDGMLAEFDEWKGLDHIGEPKDRVKMHMNTLKDLNLKIIIYTCRAKKGYKHIRNWLEKHNIPYDYINRNPEQPDTAGKSKIFSHYYIDDRNASFESLRKSVRDIILKELGDD